MKNKEIFRLNLAVSKYYSYVEYYTDSIIKNSAEDIFFTPFSLIRKIEIDNDTDQEYEELVLRFRFSLDICEIEDVHVFSIGKREKKQIHQLISQHVDEHVLYTLKNEESCSLVVSVIDPKTGNEIISVNRTVHLLPFSNRSIDVNDDFGLLSEFCIPEEKKEDEENAPVAYLDEDKNDVIKKVSDLYYDLKENSAIALVNPLSQKAFFEEVSLPEDVVKAKKGNELELAIYFSSKLVSIGYHPLLVICGGQIYCGCFLTEYDTFSSFVERKPTMVYSDAVGEDKKLILFSCSCFDRSQDISFSMAMELANEKIRAYRGEFHAIDIHRCQSSYYLPLSIGGVIPSVQLKEEEITYFHDFESEPMKERDAIDRFSTWERKLLDLSISNKLVNFSESSVSRILPADGDSLYTFLKREKGKLKAKSTSSYLLDRDGKKIKLEEDEIIKKADEAFLSDYLTFKATPSFLKELIRKDSSSREETGSPTLYIAIGELVGIDVINLKTSDIEREIHAPFLLIPATLKKDRNTDEYSLTYDLENMMVNKTFFEYYKLKKDVDYSYLYQIDSSYRFEDILGAFHENKESDVTLIENSVFLSNFSFSHMVMWQDVVSRKNSLSQNTIIKSLLENKSFVENTPLNAKHADELDQVEDLAAPLPYDSTQLKAIRECALGNSFILDGPPGTGKSQTIVNMIINAFYHGKSVLFVAEKQAALEVVRQRLANLGLDDFALQLYSPNTNKAAMFAQLGKVMSLGKQSSDEDFIQKCQEIENQKKTLNEELKKLHSRKKYFYSLYEAITKKLANDEVTVKLHFSPEFISSYNGELHDEIHLAIDQLERTYEKISTLKEEKFLPYLKITHLTYQEQLGLIPTFTKLLDELDGYHKAYLSFAKSIKENEKPTKNDLSSTLYFYDYAFKKKIILKNALKSDYFKDQKAVNDAIDALQELKKLFRENKTKYRFEYIKNTDGAKALEELKKGTNIFNRSGARKKAILELKEMLFDDKIKEPEIIAAGNLSIQVNGLLKTINAAKYILNEFFGVNVLYDLESEDNYKEIYQNTAKLYTGLANGKVPDYADKFARVEAIDDIARIKVNASFDEFAKTADAFSRSVIAVKKQYEINDDNLGIRDFFEECEEFYSFMIDEQKQKTVYDFSRINAAIEKLYQCKADSFAKALEEKTIPVEEISKTYERALSTSFVTAYFANDDFNNDFDENKYNKEITKYQELIQKYNSLCVGETIEKITERFQNPNLERSSASPLGALRKLVMTSGRGISIRNTLSKYEDLIRMYFPCFLMSPLSAAQYLDVNSRKFDVVIFDEASQIPTSEAIGPIARGNALIVAGDPQQMPPTNYFNLNLSNTEEDLNGDKAMVDDAESLLDDCLALKLPRIRLAFHYRSRHESLIQFSNTNFYGGDLFTFPSRDSKTSHISFLHIDELTKKKSSDISDQEIKAILDLLEKILDDEKNKSKTIGIIVFNTKQQAKLYDEVDNFLQKHPKYITQTHWNEEASNEKLFVKNLENVQGDERDIIIMSVGFAKAESTGKAIISGPLTLDKGERRLNVAASRSKEQMIVVSTIYASDIDADNRKSNGARALKNFLSFAQKASMPVSDEIIDSPNKDLAYFIRKELQNKGYECDVSIGHSEFKIDLAVRKKNSDEYLLGILLDEKPINENISCRDRFYVEPTILNSLHWKILRVYTYSFLRFKDDTINSIIETIESTSVEEKDDMDKFVPPVMTDHKLKKEEINYRIIPYSYYQMGVTDHINYDEMDTNYYDPESVELVKRIVKAESPISLESLKSYFKKAYEIKQLSSKASTIINNQVNNARVVKTEDYRHKIFLWDPSKPIKMEAYRESDRDILEIPKEEIIFLMNEIIHVYQTIDKEDLIKETAAMMKIDTISSRIRGKLEYTLDYAIKHQLLGNGYQENY